MKYGTHNSLTSYYLKGCYKLLYPIILLTSKCQSKSIESQLNNGCRYFDFQISDSNGDFYGSHGLALYDIDVDKALSIIDNYAKTNNVKIYYKLVYDNHFFHKRNEYLFKIFCDYYRSYYKNIECIQVAIEGNPWTFIYNKSIDESVSEKYWTLSSAKHWWNKIPLPFIYALKHNKEYKLNNKSDILMIDFL